MKPIRIETHATTIAIAQLVRLMQAGRYDCHQLTEMTGLNLNTVYRYAAAFHRAGAAHICELRPDSRGLYKTRIFKLGPGVDVKPPPARPRAERARRQRAAQRGPTNVLSTMTEALCGTTR